MDEKMLKQSYLLGVFVGTVQGMEDAVPGAQPKGNRWGEHLLALFMANMESSFQLSGKIISNLPHTVSVQGRVITVDDLKDILTEIDVEVLKLGIDESEYVRGYHNWNQLAECEVGSVEESTAVTVGDYVKIQKNQENQGNSSNPSYTLGVFLANLECMEEWIGEAGGEVAESKIENILLLLEMNFDSSMQIVDKILSTLPETTVFKGRDLSIQQLKNTRSLLDIEKMSQSTLDVEDVKKGYTQQRNLYLH